MVDVLSEEVMELEYRISASREAKLQSDRGSETCRVLLNQEACAPAECTCRSLLTPGAPA